MTSRSPSFLGVAAVAFVVTCFVFAAARARNDRCRPDRPSIAFERAQAVRTRGSGLQGSPYSISAEPVWTVRRHRGSG
ncbi:MAG: hypothetical protein O7I42_18785 [Alphaproteobacteria bacterium]|nr:hypothetical protein [Alphaproteobacteria bacterium]